MEIRLLVLCWLNIPVSLLTPRQVLGDYGHFREHPECTPPIHRTDGTLHTSPLSTLHLCKGFKVLASASHYWPLGVVDGIHEIRDSDRAGQGNGSAGTVRIHNFTVLPSHNSTSVYANDSAYSNSSATVDMVEGMISQGMYLTGQPFIYFGSYKNSCLSNPAACGPEGVTFSFFWKTQEERKKENHRKQPQARYSLASGEKVMSSGFQIYSDEQNGYVEIYTNGNAKRWKASITPPGADWTHVLFTWTSDKGLKIYVNGTLNTSDPSGSVSQNYGDPNSSLVMAANEDSSGHYVNGAFDEFIIWERALTPHEIHLYFTAATGEESVTTTAAPLTTAMSTMASLAASTDVYHSIIVHMTEEGGVLTYPETMLGYLKNISVSVPKTPLSNDTAYSLAKALLETVEEALRMPDMVDVDQEGKKVGSLIDIVDRAMMYMAINLQDPPASVVTVDGSSPVADFSMVKVPQAVVMKQYRFPAFGQSYISVPGEAFHSKIRTTIVGLLYHTMHFYYKQISPSNTKIAEAVAHKDHMIAATSHLISLKVTPAPILSSNLSGSPVITIHLAHILVSGPPVPKGQLSMVEADPFVLTVCKDMNQVSEKYKGG